MENHGIVFLNFCGNPDNKGANQTADAQAGLYLCCLYATVRFSQAEANMIKHCGNRHMCIQVIVYSQAVEKLHNSTGRLHLATVYI